MIKKATWITPKVKPAYKALNPLLQVKKKKPVEVQIEVRKTPKKKPAIKQYGDKGYKPSTGTGVGY